MHFALDIRFFNFIFFGIYFLFLARPMPENPSWQLYKRQPSGSNWVDQPIQMRAYKKIEIRLVL